MLFYDAISPLKNPLIYTLLRIRLLADDNLLPYYPAQVQAFKKMTSRYIFP